MGVLRASEGIETARPIDAPVERCSGSEPNVNCDRRTETAEILQAKELAAKTTEKTQIKRKAKGIKDKPEGLSTTASETSWLPCSAEICVRRSAGGLSGRMVRCTGKWSTGTSNIMLYCF